MKREWIDRVCELGILVLVLAILVVGPLATGAVRTWEFLSLQALTIGALSLWLVRIWAGENRRLLWTPVCWTVVAFSAYAILRYYQADIEYVARLEVAKALLYALLFFLVLNNLHRQEPAQWIAYTLFVLATGISLYAIYQFATDSHYVWNFIKPDQYLKRGTGTYICPNHLAGFLEMILPVALAFLFIGKLSHVGRIVVGYSALVMLAGIGVSISRGGWIATGLALIGFLAFLVRDRQYRIPALILLVAILGGGSLFVINAKHSQERFQSMFTAGGVEDVRFKLWHPALEMWRESPWLGVGPAHFDYRFRQFRPEDVQRKADRVHNDYLNTLADWGIVGVALVSLAWIVLFWGVRRTWKFVRPSAERLTSRKSNKAAWVLGATTGLMAILLHSAVDFNFHIPANAILAVTLMAILSSHARFATDRYWISSAWWVRLGLSVVCLAGILGLGYQGWRRWQEYLILQEANRFPEYSLKRAAVLERAFQVEPKNPDTAYEIGETYRAECFAAQQGYREAGEKAIHWFELTEKLQPFDGYNYLRQAMTLDFLKRFDEADPLMQRALELDPNGYYVIAHQGWHLVQRAAREEQDGHYDRARELYARAKEWFDRSLRLQYDKNTVALSYQAIVQRKLTELAEMR